MTSELTAAAVAVEAGAALRDVQLSGAAVARLNDTLGRDAIEWSDGRSSNQVAAFLRTGHAGPR